MISGIEIAQTVLDEVRIFAPQLMYPNSPQLEPEQRLARRLKEYPVPNADSISCVVEEVFWASLLTEEGRPCKPRLVYLPRETQRQAVHYFSEPKPLTRDTLRKLTPTHGALGYLTWNDAHGRPLLTGVQAPQLEAPADLTVTTSGSGAISVSWFVYRLLRFRAGEVTRLSTCALPDGAAVGKMVEQLLGNDGESSFLHRLVRAIEDDGHGGSVWIVQDGASLHELQMGHAVQAVGKPLLDRFPLIDPWVTSIAHLAAVDGAVVVDSRLRVLGFGAFVEIPRARTVRQRMPDGTERSISSDKLGGGRHRSAIEFCKTHAPAAAIVVSSDGRILVVLSSTRNEDPWCAEVATVGGNDLFS